MAKFIRVSFKDIFQEELYSYMTKNKFLK
jgi:hypothetical protein